MANLSSVPTLVTEGNLSRYLQEIRKFPMLEHDEEYMLAKAWREKDDVDNVFAIPLAGGEAERLSDPPRKVREVSFAPDSTRFAFVS